MTVWAVSTRKASAYDLAAVTKTPAVLIVDTRGMSLSALAEIKGFLTYKKESHIKGVILNRMSPMLYPEVKSRVEEELGHPGFWLCAEAYGAESGEPSSGAGAPG